MEGYGMAWVIAEMLDPFYRDDFAPASWIVRDEVGHIFLADHGFDDCYGKPCYEGCFIMRTMGKDRNGEAW